MKLAYLLTFLAIITLALYFNGLYKLGLLFFMMMLINCFAIIATTDKKYFEEEKKKQEKAENEWYETEREFLKKR